MQPPNLRPLKPENVEGIKMMLTEFPLGEPQSQMAREMYEENGPGLFVHFFSDGKVGSLTPPSYVTIADWFKLPLPGLPEIVVAQISSALRQYDPLQASVHLVVSAEPTDQYTGSYAWFQAPLLVKPLQNKNSLRTPRGRPKR